MTKLSELKIELEFLVWKQLKKSAPYLSNKYIDGLGLGQIGWWSIMMGKREIYDSEVQ